MGREPVSMSPRQVRKTLSLRSRIHRPGGPRADFPLSSPDSPALGAGPRPTTAKPSAETPSDSSASSSAERHAETVFARHVPAPPPRALDEGRTEAFVSDAPRASSSSSSPRMGPPSPPRVAPPPAPPPPSPAAIEPPPAPVSIHPTGYDPMQYQPAMGQQNYPAYPQQSQYPYGGYAPVQYPHYPQPPAHAHYHQAPPVNVPTGHGYHHPGRHSSAVEYTNQSFMDLAAGSGTFVGGAALNLELLEDLKPDHSNLRRSGLPWVIGGLVALFGTCALAFFLAKGIDSSAAKAKEAGKSTAAAGRPVTAPAKAAVAPAPAPAPALPVAPPADAKAATKPSASPSSAPVGDPNGGAKPKPAAAEGAKPAAAAGSATPSTKPVAEAPSEESKAAAPAPESPPVASGGRGKRRRGQGGGNNNGGGTLRDLPPPPG